PSFPLTAPATSELHTLSLHDALPISLSPCLSSSSSSCCSPLPVAGSLASTHMPKDRAGGLTTLLLIPSFYGAIAWAAWLALYEADRKSTRLNSSHVSISYAVFCLKKK